MNKLPKISTVLKMPKNKFNKNNFQLGTMQNNVKKEECHIENMSYSKI